MKSREYFEQLLSESLDRELTETEEKELAEATARYPELREFRQQLQRQAERIRALPHLHLTAEYSASQSRSKELRTTRPWWRARISVPVPVAAAAALILIVSLALATLAPGERPTAPARPLPTTIDYVQVERLQAAKAVLVESSRDTITSGEEAL